MAFVELTPAGPRRGFCYQVSPGPAGRAAEQLISQGRRTGDPTEGCQECVGFAEGDLEVFAAVFGVVEEAVALALVKVQVETSAGSGDFGFDFLRFGNGDELVLGADEKGGGRKGCGDVLEG